jgi:ribosomal protein S18 acetylase RimI-like enzyme
MVSLLYTVSTALGGTVALLEDMIVASPYQNQGAGKALLNHALAFPQNQKIKRVALLTDKTNTKAQRLY